jgi:hypothetical protein
LIWTLNGSIVIKRCLALFVHDIFANELIVEFFVPVIAPHVAQFFTVLYACGVLQDLVLAFSSLGRLGCDLS